MPTIEDFLAQQQWSLVDLATPKDPPKPRKHPFSKLRKMKQEAKGDWNAVFATLDAVERIRVINDAFSSNSKTAKDIRNFVFSQHNNVMQEDRKERKEKFVNQYNKIGDQERVPKYGPGPFPVEEETSGEQQLSTHPGLAGKSLLEQLFRARARAILDKQDLQEFRNKNDVSRTPVQRYYGQRINQQRPTQGEEKLYDKLQKYPGMTEEQYNKILNRDIKMGRPRIAAVSDEEYDSIQDTLKWS